MAARFGHLQKQDRAKPPGIPATTPDAGFGRALQTIWLGEAVSIAVMEIAMNGVDYWMGGMQVMSVMEPIFWISLLAAIPAGYIAAWPVNWWLIGKNLKHCH